MRDQILEHVRNTFHLRHGHGVVDQSRGAGALFKGDFSASTTAGAEFAGSRLGLGVMHDLNGEVVSVKGKTWRIPVSGIPIEVLPSEGLAFGIAAHGGREHQITIPVGSDMTGILSAIDAHLAERHVDHEDVVCAIEMVGSFTNVLLRTEAPATFPNETLSEVLEHETRFEFEQWRGTLVGFRFPNENDGQRIPGLHFHAISENQTSGGHVHKVVTADVFATLWVDELHPMREIQ
jgi:acetolactate decarboxylase